MSGEEIDLFRVMTGRTTLSLSMSKSDQAAPVENHCSDLGDRETSLDSYRESNAGSTRPQKADIACSYEFGEEHTSEAAPIGVRLENARSSTPNGLTQSNARGIGKETRCCEKKKKKKHQKINSLETYWGNGGLNEKPSFNHLIQRMNSAIWANKVLISTRTSR